jgi:UPF0755 protein
MRDARPLEALMRRAWTWGLAGIVGCSAPAGGPPEQVTVPAGSSFAAMTDSLATHGIITNRRLFKVLARLRGLDRKLKAGVYELPKGSSAWAVIDALEKGQHVLLRVTIPEGLTLDEIAPLAEDALQIPRDSFLVAARDAAAAQLYVAGATSFEGLLLPETYLVPQGSSARELVKHMADKARALWTPEWTSRLDSLGLTRLHLLALASIVEGEARVDEERPVIAAVYWNRIRKHMPLQADPTVQYAIQLATGRRKSRLLFKDYQFPSPYNTYRNTGLPPGPVNSPSRKSIEAALYPSEVPYLFFVARSDGRHVFTRTYGEHLRAIRAVRTGYGGRGTGNGSSAGSRERGTENGPTDSTR